MLSAMTAAGMRALGDEVMAFLLAAQCAGCDRPGTLLCETCRAALLAAPTWQRTSAGLPVLASLRYEGVVARCIRALKEEGATALARPLGRALAAAWRCAALADVRAVPIPTTIRAFRRRGYRVPELLLHHVGERPVRMLAPVRRIEDQRDLGRRARASNVGGSLRHRGVVGAGEVVLIDDVVTTGATLDEATRALRAAGISVRCAVVLASTPASAGGERDVVGGKGESQGNKG